MSAANGLKEPDPLLRVASLVPDSIVDGPGLRLAVFVQGCSRNCPGCHNPQSHDPAGGHDAPVSHILRMARKNPLLAGLTITGGEPLEQPGPCLALARALPQGLSLWLYTGYTYEEIMTSGSPDQRALALACHVLVDGPFLLAERSLELLFRGSRNQRLLDMKKTRAQGRIVLWEPEPFVDACLAP